MSDGGPMVPGSPTSSPGDPNYISLAESTRRHMERMAEYEARPDVIERRRQHAEYLARVAADKAAARKQPPPNTDYPWLRDGSWVDRQPVKPGKG